MKGQVVKIQGQKVAIAFRAENSAEQQVLIDLKANSRPSADAGFMLIEWVEAALRKSGRHNYICLEYLDHIEENYVFKVEKVQGLGN